MLFCTSVENNIQIWISLSPPLSPADLDLSNHHDGRLQFTSRTAPERKFAFVEIASKQDIMTTAKLPSPCILYCTADGITVTLVVVSIICAELLTVD